MPARSVGAPSAGTTARSVVSTWDLRPHTAPLCETSESLKRGALRLFTLSKGTPRDNRSERAALSDSEGSSTAERGEPEGRKSEKRYRRRYAYSGRSPQGDFMSPFEIDITDPGESKERFSWTAASSPPWPRTRLRR